MWIPVHAERVENKYLYKLIVFINELLITLTYDLIYYWRGSFAPGRLVTRLCPNAFQGYHVHIVIYKQKRQQILFLADSWLWLWSITRITTRF